MFTERYERKLKGNSLILIEDCVKEESFEEKMICENSIKGLLPCEVRYEDDKKTFIYDITSKQSLMQLFEERMLQESDIRKIIQALIQIKSVFEDYLLSEDNLILDPKFVFEDPDQRNPYFVFYPYYDRGIDDSLTVLSTFLMERTDHKDEEAVKLVYGFYKCVFNKDYVFEKLLYKKVIETKEDDRNSKISEKSEIREISEISEISEASVKNEKSEKPAVIISTISLLVLIAGVIAIQFIDLGFNASEKRTIAGVIALIGALTLSFPICLIVSRAKKAQNDERLRSIKDDVIETYQKRKIVEITENKNYGRTGNLRNEIKEIRRIVCYGMDEVLEFRIVKTPFLIGKSEKEVDGVINDEAISRMHAKITVSGDKYYITDLNSTNGTKVNGTLLNANETVEICVNDEISFAGDVFYFR